MAVGNLFMAVFVHCLDQCLEHIWHQINADNINVLLDAEYFVKCTTKNIQT